MCVRFTNQDYSLQCVIFLSFCIIMQVLRGRDLDKRGCASKNIQSSRYDGSNLLRIWIDWMNAVQAVQNSNMAPSICYSIGETITLQVSWKYAMEVKYKCRYVSCKWQTLDVILFFFIDYYVLHGLYGRHPPMCPRDTEAKELVN